MKKKKLPKERNPFVEAMRFRKAGRFGKTKKAERRKAKMEFKKEMTYVN